jgi:HAD superfamily hydrolase (TIGR01490 family)
MRWAVFDVDGTLLPFTSLEKMFVGYALKSGLLPPLNMMNYLLRAGNLLLQGKTFDAFKRNKMFLKGLPAEAVEKTAGDFFTPQIITRFSSKGLQTVQQHREEGFKILLLTGSPIFLARRLGNLYKPDHLIALNLEIRDFRYTGNITGKHPYGEFKKQLLLEVKPDLQIDFEQSRVYANHHSDAAHMELFGQAIAVNPTGKLQQIARERSWNIEKWD